MTTYQDVLGIHQVMVESFGGAAGVDATGHESPPVLPVAGWYELKLFSKLINKLPAVIN